MKISWDWLKDYIEVDISVESVSEYLTQIGLEIEDIQSIQFPKGGLINYVIGHIDSCEQHPNADKLKLTKVNCGNEIGELQIVCGAPNVAKGQTVVVATEGATVYLANGESFEIKKTKLRGEVSEGMICSESELGLGDSHDGIMVIDENVKPGTLASDYFQVYSDTVFEIGLTPNRTDAMCHYGVARDLAARLKVKKIPFTFKKEGGFPKSTKSESLKNDYTAIVETKEAPILSLQVFDNLKSQITDKKISNRLRAIGESPKNFIIDVTNYVVHDIGQPVHAYDADKLNNNAFTTSNASKNETFLPLIGEELKLIETDIVIKTGKVTVALAGVMGGHNTKVDDNTNKILLESAYFYPTPIRQTSQRMGLKTEASSHFEKGVDPNQVFYAQNRFRDIVAYCLPESNYSNIVSTEDVNFPPFEVQLTQIKLDKYIGLVIPAETVSEILTSLEIEIVEYENGVWKLKVPRFKNDVTREEDVIEEVMRIYGYNEIPYPKYLKSNLSFESETNYSKINKSISDYFVGTGFSEIMTNTISQSKYYNKGELVMLLNSMTSELDCLRSSMIPEVAKVIDHNIRYGNKNVQFFEIGKQYKKDKASYKEERKLISVITGFNQEPSWIYPKGDNNNFQLLKRHLELFFEKNKLEVSYIETEDKIYHYGLDIIYRNKVLGTIGLLNLEFMNDISIDQDVYYFELHMDMIYPILSSQKVQYIPLTKYPAVTRDLSMIIDNSISYQTLEDISYNAMKGMLTKMELFDVFKGEKLGKDKKSYAVRFTFLDRSKTLTDKEIDKSMNQLINAFEKEAKAEIRS